MNASNARIGAVDIVRGMAIIVMALDHTRDFLGVNINPVGLTTTTAPLFFTRWITHLCAPTFFLLTGTSAYLSKRDQSPSALSRHPPHPGRLAAFAGNHGVSARIAIQLRLSDNRAECAVGAGLGDAHPRPVGPLATRRDCSLRTRPAFRDTMPWIRFAPPTRSGPCSTFPMSYSIRRSTACWPGMHSFPGLG